MFNGFYFLIIKIINNGNLGGGRHPEIYALYIKWFWPSLRFGSTIVSSSRKG